MTTKTIEEQKAVISYLLNNPEMYKEVSLEPKVFNSGNDSVDTRVVYEAFTDLIAEQTMPDPLLISQKTGLRVSHIKKFYDVEYVPANIDKYLKSIRNEAIRSELLELGFSVQQLAETLDDPTSAPLVIQEMINTINFDGDVDLIDSSFGAILDKSVAKSELEKDMPLSEKLVETPFNEFNRRFGGLFMGDYTVVAGATSAGKTVLASDLITCALDNNIKVGSVILEMSEEQLIQRQISRYSANLDMTNIRKGDFHHNPSMKQDYNNAIRKLQGHRDLWNIYGTENVNLERILAIGRKMALNGVKLFTVDYLQLIQYDKYAKDRTLAIGLASQALAQLAKSTNMHVLAVAQLNREFSKRQDKRPTVADLKESSYVEQSADNILLIYRDIMYNPESEKGNTTELDLAKGRNVGTGVMDIMWNPDIPSFTDIPMI